ncbi:hypothetical protein [Ethanoligenens harbinense]|uniref:Uncharacterized protein n=1 Tax=Ethanoligenens harbinense (strain DSM 18485 / JCM 12961 / CGMCC 1.5033 / YUAN-3) TaxID=663278 RepID=E6U4I9_ETHHY|nr:hypothetical protein [Ethanoligenens harbinense]ADU26617.1 hypothetical protein Ethha_1064 [Ethanoligenens harbinense YUAN-3]AVQ95740.1 hypothetical protein CXQ68_05510 [Ethanoligenens harbinense YUAN-3]AYF38403.1 hypothetical protein CXP51_05370 [Ethanoligenens harbinense]AYF41148.1 hypothetical protein CN246_05505 [Ethanoligenens harbinense]QCN91979.1 hypothetical protein DRA42_05525 [Ethanoligenens harbinense]
MANKQARGVALGGMLTALSLVLLVLAGVLPMMQLVFPAVAGLLLVVVVLELHIKWAWGIFAAVTLLGLLLCPDKSVVVYYVFFFGHYPLLKNYIERLRSRAVQWLVKIPLFNACIILAYLAIAKLFGVPEDLLRYGYPFALALANAAFILYDIALSRLIVTYIYRVRKLLHRK